MRALFVSLLLLVAPGVSIAVAADRVALVIGNSAYRHVAVLSNPTNDAGDVAALLRKLDFDVVEGRDLDRKAMEEAIGAFRGKLERAKLAVFFYAGHGLQLEGRNYLLPTDAEIGQAADLNFNAVNLEYVLKQMDVLRRVNLIFLDACRDNPFASLLSRSVATQSTTGLAPIKGAIDTMIAFSTEPDNVALDGQGRNSPYTSALLAHLATPGTDISRIMRLVRRDVLTATNNRQVPWEHLSLVDDVILTPAAGSAPAQRPAGDEPRVVSPQGSSGGFSSAAVAASECDRLAADSFSPNKPANVRGVHRNAISRDAIKVCADAVAANPDLPRLVHELGRALYTHEDYAGALKAFREAQSRGIVESTTEMCRMSFFGHGVPKNVGKARELCEKAAAEGDPSAIKNIGFFYHKGHGVKQSYAKAIEWYNRAPNHPTVMNNMGVLYEEGAGVPQSFVKARQLYEKAVLGGDEAAMGNLGDMYEKGKGIRRDLAKGKLLYQMASALGDKEAKQALARLR